MENRKVDELYLQYTKHFDLCEFCRNQEKCIMRNWKVCKPSINQGKLSRFVITKKH